MYKLKIWKWSKIWNYYHPMYIVVVVIVDKKYTCLSGWLRYLKRDKNPIWRSHCPRLKDHDPCLILCACSLRTKLVPSTYSVSATRTDSCVRSVVVRQVGLLHYAVSSNATMAIKSASNRVPSCTAHVRVLLHGSMQRTSCQPLHQVYPRCSFRSNWVSNDTRQHSICCISFVQRSLHLTGKN